MGRKRKNLTDTGSETRPRNSANERERERMRVLSRAFTKLKTRLPWVPPDTKLSKLDTLRLATCYIRYLRKLLLESDPDEDVMSQERSDDVKEEGTRDAVHPINFVSSLIILHKLFLVLYTENWSSQMDFFW